MGQSTPYLLNALPGSSYVKLWGSTAPTVGGLATFYPTDDGTPEGLPIFTGLSPAVSLTAEMDTTKASSTPFASVKKIAPDKRSIVVNVAVGATMVATGDTLLPAPDGTVVHCFIIGT